MPIIAIASQPAASSLNAAYRPVVLRVSATATDTTPIPPVVYCDIYFNGVYYKTLSKTLYVKLNVSDSEFEFDIQDACQEYLKPFLASNGGSAILEAPTTFVNVLCKFRSSGYNADGFLIPEGTIPVQGTGSTAPTAGTGTSSNTFVVLNVSLQHNDNQVLASHLASYRNGSWNAVYYPLSHRPQGYKLSAGASDYFPVVVPNISLVTSITINYRYINQITVRQITADVTPPSTTGINVAYVPNGVKNIASLFPGLNFFDVYDYFLQLKNNAGDILATLGTNTIVKGDQNDIVRVHFQTYTGTIDAIDFTYVTVNHETKSDNFQVPLPIPFSRTTHAAGRFNVKSNDTFNVVTIDYEEKDLDWIDEVLDSPVAWMQWKGEQGQSDSYLPILITDKKTEKRKEEDRYVYEVTLEFTLSHERITIRN